VFEKASKNRFFFTFPLEAFFFIPKKVAYQNFMRCHELAMHINQ